MKVMQTHYVIRRKDLCCTEKWALKEVARMYETTSGVIAAKAHLLRRERKSRRLVYRFECVIDRERMLEDNPEIERRWALAGRRLNRGVREDQP